MGLIQNDYELRVYCNDNTYSRKEIDPGESSRRPNFRKLPTTSTTFQRSCLPNDRRVGSGDVVVFDGFGEKEYYEVMSYPMKRVERSTLILSLRRLNFTSGRLQR